LEPPRSDLAVTKFSPPHVPAAFVPRPRLTTRLDAGVRGALTVVSGPAGAGKSVLLADWASRHARVAWLSLEPLDHGRRRFWRAVLEALQRSQPATPLGSLAVQPGAPADLLLPELAAALESLTAPVTLVLDDVHEIGDSQALSDLDRLLRGPLPSLRVVIVTRSDPPLRLGRLRAAGQLTELREADLAFTLDEARRLLDQPDLPGDVAERVWRRTEGWAAGLRLAALALRTHPDPSRFADEFGGDDRSVADYLVAEVLAQQPPDFRRFLLRISILDRVSPGLAAALTGRSESDRLLTRLEHDHALLTSIDSRSEWRRLHPLFAELLRSELRFSAPEEIPTLHGRAARWFQQHDQPLEALEHAVAADDWALVGALAGTRWVPLLLEGEVGSLRPVLERLPSDVATGDPELALAVAGVHLDAGNAGVAAPWFDAAVAARDGVPAERRGAFDLALAAVGVLQGRLDGNIEAALAHARALVEQDAVGDDLKALALTQVGIAELWMGDLERAERDLRAGRDAAQAAGRDWLRLICTAHLVVHAMVGGHYDTALGLADEAERLAGERGWQRTWPLGVVAGARSAVALHREQIDEAEAQLGRSVELLDSSVDPPLRAMTLLQQAGVLAAQGRYEPALDAIGAAKRWLREWPINPPMRELLLSFEATVHGALGQRTQAMALLRSEAGGQSLEVAVAIARLALQADEADKALSVLEPHLDAPGASFDFSRTEAWLLTALAHDARADDASASDALEHALRAGSPAGLRRPFLAQGSGIVPLLRRQLRTGTGHRELVEDLLEAVEHPGAGRPQALLMEPLSEREVAVLRFLPTMMSNQEIAAELFVSVNTVKTHLKAIYRKLDVRDRRSAVLRARELELVGPA
jgi:LuxR family transcriptional regulator, maltose regulon positive regulatory protein